MLRTRFTDLAGVEHPLMMGGLQWLGVAEFAAAFSNAGGLGTISGLTYGGPQELRAAIRRVRELTPRPFAVNISMLPMHGAEAMVEPLVRVACEERVPVVETAGRNPEPFVAALHAAGAKIIHKVPAARYALKAEQVGADAVTIVGFECGGHPGMDDVPTAIAVQSALEKVRVPLLAGGGLATGRGLLAALALGAEGVVMGTRLLATAECPLHENFKRWLIEADELGTAVVGRSYRNPIRIRRNAAAEEVLRREAAGATLEELLEIVGGQVGLEACRTGDLDRGAVACGLDVALIHDVPPVADLVRRIVAEAEEGRARLARL